MNTPKILIGALAGLAAGVVIGMLVAPEKGATLRKNLIKKGGEFADAVSDFEHKVVGKFVKPKGENDLRKKEVEV